MDHKHVKLVGGSINTAKHDLEKIKTARESNSKILKDEKEREHARRSRQFGQDIEW